MLDPSNLLGQKGLLVAVLGSAAASLIVVALMSRRKRQHGDFQEMVGTVSALYCYPVKSLKGISHEVAFCTQAGMRMLNAMDRQFVVVRPNGDFITQRQNPRMAAITTVSAGDDLILQADGMPDIKVPLLPKVNQDAIVSCRVWSDHLQAQDCGSEASQWLSDFLLEPGLRLLVRAPGVTDRSCRVKNARDQDKLLFQDEGPIMMATEKSLDNLLTRIGPPANEEISMCNLRPNIVITGTGFPWEEDEWSHLLIGKNLKMKVLAPVERCVLTTVDPKTLARRDDGEPLKTLKSFRIKPEVSKVSPLFGITLGVETENTIRVGDPVFVRRKEL